MDPHEAPVEVEVEVGCSPDHAWRLWTERMDVWWPPGKSVAGGDAEVVVEARPGGRIYERTPDGVEHDWGRVVATDPPHRIAFTWHLMFDAADATDVEVTFTPIADGTRVRVVHTGWDRLARERGTDVAAQRRDRNRAGWTAVTAAFRAAAGD
ncbi:SRPBCC domain-containing protein [Euzebya sp.]|uniref:SRPBCC domain-containing protein n=1 Tax=Euzebya sp. TaxID=1971409 RepID=UPI00355A2C40